MKLLAIRLSAFGDVAMTVPVIDSLARQYPQLEITVLSKPHMQPLFAHMPANVHFCGIDVRLYKGFYGLVRLFCLLRKERFTAVADLHDVLRSKVIRLLFALSGVPTAHIDKGRKDKKALTRPARKCLMQLPSSFSRYEAVFARLGYPVKTTFRSIFGEGKGDIAHLYLLTGHPDGRHWIGFAPFAAHQGKILPQATTETLIRQLSARPDLRLFLFGGGTAETQRLEQWAAASPNAVSMAGKLKLEEELALMSHMDAMVSMDSANMHLASLTGTPVISVWGATHPFAGFMGWGQTAENAVQTDLPCRPCSIFGNKPCRRADYACLTMLKAEEVVKKIDGLLKAKANASACK